MKKAPRVGCFLLHFIPKYGRIKIKRCVKGSENVRNSKKNVLLKNNCTKNPPAAFVAIIFSLIILVIILVGVTEDATTSKGDTTATAAKNGEAYELVVWQAFWESTSKVFGIEYSDYKITYTVCDYIQNFTTSDGYESHYYLVKTAFETENAAGEKILHPVTARCYYVPQHSNTVYTTYLTLDSKKVFFDEECEDWLMGMGGGTPNITKRITTGTVATTKGISTTKKTSAKKDSLGEEYDREKAELEWLSKLPTIGGQGALPSHVEYDYESIFGKTESSEYDYGSLFIKMESDE